MAAWGHLSRLSAASLSTEDNHQVVCDGLYDLLFLTYDRQLAPGFFDCGRPLYVDDPCRAKLPIAG